MLFVDPHLQLQYLISYSQGLQFEQCIVVILGDFNYPTTNFDDGFRRGPEATVFYELTHELDLHEHIQQSTRWCDGQNPLQLDLALTNEPHLIDRVELDFPLGASDHAVVHLKLVNKIAIKYSKST